MTVKGRVPKNGLSHVMGDKTDPLVNITIPELLARTATRLPDHEAAIFPAQNIRWSYADLAREVDAVAVGLLRTGVAKGDRVGIWSPNRVEWLLTQFATARIGALLVCINPAYRVSELEYALNKVGCKTLIMSSQFKGSNYVGMIQELAPELSRCAPGHLSAVRLPHLRNVLVMGHETPPGAFAFDTLQSGADPTAILQLDRITKGLSPTDPINIQFTSGTTGHPKGACLTHHNIVNNATFVTQAMTFTEQDRLCIPVPFYHCFGMVMGTLGCVTKGATMVVPGEGFDPRATLQAVSDDGCTALFGVPTVLVK